MLDRLTKLFVVAIGTMVLAACAARTGDGGDRQHAGDAGAGALAGPTVVVPNLVGGDATTVDKSAVSAGLVPIVEYVAGGTKPAGTVVRVDPAPGTVVPVGSTITVEVSGAPGMTVDELVAADRRNFVGLGVDPDGTLVVAVAPGVDANAAVRRIEPVLAGRKYRVKQCSTSWAELSRISIELTRRDDVRKSTGFTVVLDPAACAVRVEGDIAPDVATAVREAYPGTVIVASGPPASRAVG